MKDAKDADDNYTPSEANRRRDETIKRMLATPPLKHADEKHPRKPVKKNGGKPKPAPAARSKSKQGKK